MAHLHASVVGAGLAGTEAAMQLAKRGIRVTLYEMKPKRFSPAHFNEDFAELVCSNSFKAQRLSSAAGLLKQEMRILGSVCLAQRKRRGCRRVERLRLTVIFFLRKSQRK